MNYTVETPCGKITGIKDNRSGAIAFRGIKYATAERWSLPVEITHWDGTLIADHFGPAAFQPRAYNDDSVTSKINAYYNREFREGLSFEYSEDCLYLNIFVPETADTGSNLPVIFFIHGGSFKNCSTAERPFDSPAWTEKNVIAVTIEYRLGPLGFLCLPELMERDGFTGNYGLFDQLTALQWVNHNIKSFGGNPDNVTVFGQSAGAISTQILCLSPLTEGLISKAVMSSGGGVANLPVPSPAEKNYEFWKKVQAECNAGTLEEFISTDMQTLFNAWEKVNEKNSLPFPCIDGKLLTDSPQKITRRKNVPVIPYMLGTTSHDMGGPLFHIMAKNWGKIQNKNKNTNCYLWHFTHILPGDHYGAWHSSDLAYWFGNLRQTWRPVDENEDMFSEKMVSYLINFAYTGNPNGKNLPEWKSYSESRKELFLEHNDSLYMNRSSGFKMLMRMMFAKKLGD